MSRIRELRFRSGKPAVAVTDDGVRFVMPSGRLTTVFSELVMKTDESELKEIFYRLSGYSVHSFTESVNHGFITVEGGHRVGIGGTAVTENGKIISVRDIECINIRIAREIKGAADEIYSLCFSDGIKSIILAGPPSSGKTTVLRDLARQLSGGERGIYASVFVCDERGELGASFCGTAQNDLGVNCDIITSYPKSEGILIGLRAFNPQVIICDETSSDEEVTAIEYGLNSGANFILSIHAGSEKELRNKPVLKKLLCTGAFEKVVLLSSVNICRAEKVYEAGDLID